MNQALSVPCSDQLYIERDSPNIEILRKAEKIDILFLLEVIFFHICMEELQKYSRTNMHKPIL